MGCDIHGFLQRKYKFSTKWDNVCPIPRSRNYDLFSALADVRNYNNVTPICAPRGLPDDVFNTYEPILSEGDFGDHSYSWLSFTEARDWPGWQQPMRVSGVIDRKAFEVLHSDSVLPTSWCQSIAGPGIKIVDKQHALANPDNTDWTHVRCRWNDGILEDSCQAFLAWLNYVDLEFDREHTELRIVFGFDS